MTESRAWPRAPWTPADGIDRELRVGVSLADHITGWPLDAGVTARARPTKIGELESLAAAVVIDPASLFAGSSARHAWSPVFGSETPVRCVGSPMGSAPLGPGAAAGMRLGGVLERTMLVRVVTGARVLFGHDAGDLPVGTVFVPPDTACVFGRIGALRLTGSAADSAGADIAATRGGTAVPNGSPQSPRLPRAFGPGQRKDTMKPIACVGDPIIGGDHCHGHDHGPQPAPGQIIRGASKVFIRGRPAARLGDQGHSSCCCGGGGPIIIGATQTRVFIEGQPAASQGCPTTHCGTGVGTIQGVPNGVYIP